MRFDGRDEVDVEFEERLTRALVAAPAPVVASDFAARVAMRARQEGVRRPVVALDSTGYGRLAVYLALPVLLLVMVLMARFAVPMSPVTLAVEGLTTLEVVMVGLYLAMRAGARGR